MTALIIFGALALFVWIITKYEDANVRARGETADAPGWARVLFVLLGAALLFACLGPGLLMGLESVQP